MTPSPPFLSRFLQQTSPDIAVVLGAAGVLLILYEFNRPGRVLPAALGLLLTLLAVAFFLMHGARPGAVALLLLAASFFLLNLGIRLPSWLLGVATLAAIAGLRFLTRDGNAHPVHTVVAVLCGGGLGLLSAWLTRAAHRARRAKALN